MKCFVHIGTEKTGTTTIQKFFSENRARLPSHGFYYSRSFGNLNNRMLPLCVYPPHRRDDITRAFDLQSDEQLLAFQKRTIANFKEEVRALPDTTAVIFSSEHIQSRLTTLQDVQRLRALLEELGFTETTIIAYLRNPSETATSLYSTSIKSGSTMEDVPPPTDTHFNIVCNHRETAKRFTAVFGRQNVILRLFRKEKFRQGSLIADIAGLMNLELKGQDLVFPEKQNESLSLLGLKILRSVNEAFPRHGKTEYRKHRKELIGLLTQYCSEPKFAMSIEQFEEYDAYFAESNEYIRTNYFPEEEILFPYRRPTPSQVSWSPQELGGISNLIKDLWIGKVNAEESKWYQLGLKSNKQRAGALVRMLIR